MIIVRWMSVGRVCVVVLYHSSCVSGGVSVCAVGHECGMMQDGRTSLALAAAEGHKEVVAMLVEAGANIEAEGEVSDVICGMQSWNEVDVGVW